MDELRERAEKRRDALQAELEKFVQDANTRITAYQTAIAVLDELLKDDSKNEPPLPV